MVGSLYLVHSSTEQGVAQKPQMGNEGSGNCSVSHAFQAHEHDHLRHLEGVESGALNVYVEVM